jgi:hypothetical protein
MIWALLIQYTKLVNSFLISTDHYLTRTLENFYTVKNRCTLLYIHAVLCCNYLFGIRCLVFDCVVHDIIIS